LGKIQKNWQDIRAENNTQAIAVPAAALATTDLNGLFLSLHQESIFSIFKIIFFGHEAIF